MRLPFVLLSSALLLTASIPSPLPAQQETQSASPQLIRRPPGTEILKTGTQLVIVDVVVEDRNGHPVHGLAQSDFALTEDKKPQTVRNFDEHSRATPGTTPIPAMPKLPPGTFTDYTPVPPDGALNILLLDALNTPMKDQSYVRYQLQQYVKHANPGTRIAIFGLSSRLTILQGFTSQPEVLKDAIDHKLIPRASDLLDDPLSGEDNSDLLQTSANLAQFNSQVQSSQGQMRMQYTLDAFNQIARYLSGLPGRKNLIWFSGSFPLDILPDDTLADPFSVVSGSEEEFRETANLLTQSRVSVYPIDARGLMTNPVFNASQSGRGMSRNPNAFAGKIAGFSRSQAQEHDTMDQLAEDTGGRAFYNTNGLAQAVDKAIEAGSNYYTLAYTPTDHKADGAYRNIRVTLNEPWAGQHLQLAYRHGYYADEPGNKPQASAISLVSDAANEAHRVAITYAQAAMGRGAPAPSDILFKVRVLPASTTTEATVAPHNSLDPNSPLKGPFRRYDIDFVALPSSFTFTPGPDGKRNGAIQFTVFVYDADGKLLNADGQTVNLTFPPDAYATFQKQAIDMHLEVSAPVKPESFLRIGVHDLPTNRFGVVEIPTASVSHLAPPVYPAAPANLTTQPAH